MKKNENIKDAIAYSLIIFSTFLIINFIFKDGFLYGSAMDWFSQHIVLSDYFRQKFYETGNLFPDFAMNLGGGQNIYNLSYYGLFSPIILISYLFPSVSMVTYISVSSIMIVVISACLCYRWLRTNGFSREISFTATICFLCAGPLIFQSHRQIMFMNYFPFLLLGLLGVDQYYKNHKKWIFIISVFLCIMTSYFFSVGGIVALLIYMIYKFIKRREHFAFPELWAEIFPLVKGIAIAILMAAVLWLPTLYVIASGGRSGVESISVFSLLIPTLPFSALLFSPYSLGLTIITLIALIVTLFSKNKSEKFFSLILLLLLIFPIFMYLLDGTLYVRTKSLIPILPLYIYVTAIFLSNLVRFINKKKNIKPSQVKIIICAILFIINIISIVPCIIINGYDTLATMKNYSEIHSPKKLELIQETLNKDFSFYRINDLTNASESSNQVYDPRYYQTSIYSSTYNKDYNKFYFDILHNSIPSRNRVITASSKNILFQNYMNVKYIIAEGSSVAGYHKIGQKGDYILYKNNNTLPLGFATDQVIDQKYFESITYPFNMGTLFENIVVSKKLKTRNEGIKKSAFNFHMIDLKSDLLLIQNQKNVIITKENGHYNIKAKEGASLEIPLSINLKDEVLLISFMILDKNHRKNVDTSITINEIKNKLSGKSAAYPNDNTNFVYILSSNESLKQLTLNFSAGNYEVSNLEAYILPAATIGAAISKMDPFIIDIKNAMDNQIVGDIQVKDDGYFATTLPFDKGFDIKVDGKKQSYEKVNTAFVGFHIIKGIHHIEIHYNAPYKKTGMALSIIGLLLFILTSIRDLKRKAYPLKGINNGEENNRV